MCRNAITPFGESKEQVKTREPTALVEDITVRPLQGNIDCLEINENEMHGVDWGKTS
jgi:hypothetical protein